jgi:hypothetical protein
MNATDNRNGSAAFCWAGPFRIGDYLANVTRQREARPPDASGVYVLTERTWQTMPTKQANIVYAGQAQYLRYRIGQLLCDLFGFTGDDSADGDAYEHRGGHLVWHRYCIARNMEPLNLYVGWCTPCNCMDCAEARLLDLMAIGLGSAARRTCHRHSPMLDLLDACSASVTRPAGLA